MTRQPKTDRSFRPWPQALNLVANLLSGADVIASGLTSEDWRTFTNLVVDRHRVAPMVLKAASDIGLEMPTEVAAAISSTANNDAAAALRQKAESFRVLSQLANAGCRPSVLKGWPLAEALYGSAGLRHAKDLDLYIAPHEIDLCIAVMADLGYEIDDEHRARIPFIDRPGFRQEFNDLSLYHAARDVQIEVHWRSYHFRGWPDLRNIPGALQDWPLDRTGLIVRVPSPTANLIYLSLHGQQHIWLRLKWLLDIARIFTSRDDAQLIGDLSAAREVGAGRAVIIAGHLAQVVLGSPLPSSWPVPDHAGTRAIERFRQLIADDDSAPGTLRARFHYYWMSLVLAESLSQRVGVLRTMPETR